MSDMYHGGTSGANNEVMNKMRQMLANPDRPAPSQKRGEGGTGYQPTSSVPGIGYPEGMAGQQPQNPQDGDPTLRGWRDFFNQPRGEQQGGWRDVFNQPRGEQQGGWMNRAKEIFNQRRG